MVKGLAAGATNLALALALGASWPPPGIVAAAALVGFGSYGASLTLFVVGLRELGTARTGAYFSVAPFFGALLAVTLLGEPLTASLVAAGVLMAVGVALHLSERHEHPHAHEPADHSHEHVHGAGDPHHHDALVHSHPHFPDAHHRHQH